MMYPMVDTLHLSDENKSRRSAPKQIRELFNHRSDNYAVVINRADNEEFARWNPKQLKQITHVMDRRASRLLQRC
jgi:hypothetical protein